MNTRRIHTLQVTGLLMIGLLALAACQVAGTERPMEPEVGNVRDSSSLLEGQSARSLAADQARWEAKAEQHKVLSDGAILAEQTRWDAILHTNAEAARARSLAADQARWEAMAGLAAGLSDGAILAEQARWNVILESYAEAARARSLAADQARWQGQAEFFANGREVKAAGRSNLALSAHYTGLAFQHYELTGNTASLPGSVSPALRGMLAAGGVEVDTVMAASPARQNQ